jgi:hypothetical protein
MNVVDVLQQLRDLFRRKPEIPRGPLEWMIRSLELTADREISCDEVFALLISAPTRGAWRAAELMLLRWHLRSAKNAARHSAGVGEVEPHTEKLPSLSPTVQ